MRILKLRAARGWSLAQTAKSFLVTEDTMASWIRRVDEQGERALVQTEEPVNKYPEFVAQLVRELKLICPDFGKVRIAQVLARAGLQLGATTVGRMLARCPTRKAADATQEPLDSTRRILVAKGPDHIWHVDLTTIPTSLGFWVPWPPFSRPQRWPFCWWAAIAVDHASRLVIGIALFKRRPTAAQVTAFLSITMRRSGSRPRHIIADKGKEFFCRPFKAWCRLHGIRPRFGAIGQHGSIAVVERFIRSMKSECAKRIMVPMRLADMRHELACYATWYNEYRPHSALGGRTPLEVHRGNAPACEEPRFEPRERWPHQAQISGRAGARLKLVVRRLQGRSHLPIVERKRSTNGTWRALASAVP
jgi:transposase InsO family protein